MKVNEIIEVKAGDLDEVKYYSNSDMHITREKLTSLEGCPKEITGDFQCRNNLLTSLEGCPEKVLGFFGCADNQLTSFEHFPKYVGGNCYISYNKFTSFKDIDQHIEFIGDRLFANNMNIKSGYSDLFGIDGLEELNIDNKDIQQIVNHHLPTKDLINFQDEMIKAGYESYL